VQDSIGEKDPNATRLMSGFGGGIGGMGSVCGAIVGGVAALSARYGRGTAEEREDRKLFSMCAELYRRFGDEIETSQLCREITGIDFTDREQAKSYYASPEKTARCARLVGKTAEMVCEMIEREDAKTPQPSPGRD
jgi:C_GCAxxG_C_C family probable redox protein